MKKEKTHLSIRMDSLLHDRFRYVAGAEGRTMSGQILYLIQKCVRDFEKEHGTIKAEDLGE
ncbi:MAG: hypothetical protein J6R39_01960 [Oscillospiraceae bacterium]|nr:hypothetical protein [Oscillospiraceae bacterium]